MKELIQSSVVFDSEGHTYRTPEGKVLSGVTTLLSRQIFKDKYSGISPAVLQKAADHGHAVHEAIECYDTFGVGSDLPELKWYLALKTQLGIATLANEYLVSDNAHVASSIDIVFEDGTLADIKTTSKLDREYLSWQLSTYAYLFELQNPGVKAGRLMAIWLPNPRYGKPALVEVPRIGADEIALLIEADSQGLEYTPSLVKTTETSITVPENLIEEVCRIETEMKSAKARFEELRAGLQALMEENGCKKFTSPALTLTYRDAYQREDFDKGALKEQYPEIYTQFIRQTTVKPSLTIKVSV